MRLLKFLERLDPNYEYKNEDERREKWRKEQIALYPQKRMDAMAQKQVLCVTFKCSNCNKTWEYSYPTGIKVGYSNFGHPNSEHGWVTDNFSYDKSLYDYKCPNCKDLDIGIIKRTSVERL